MYQSLMKLRNKMKTLTKAEEEIMQVLWQLGKNIGQRCDIRIARTQTGL